MPTGALVRIAGCLTGSDQTWSVTSANSPVRTRTSETTDYQEFKASEDAPAGGQTFGLFNLGFLGSKFKPEDNVGKKLMIKGNLIQQANSARITVLAIRKIADNCPCVRYLTHLRIKMKLLPGIAVFILP